MSNLSKAISLGRTILVAAIISATPALASTGGYDGHWNVQISSNRPNCPSGASFAIAIASGQIAPAGGLVPVREIFGSEHILAGLVMLQAFFANDVAQAEEEVIGLVMVRPIERGGLPHQTRE